MKIKFTNYDDGIHHFEFLKDVENLDLDDRFIGKLKVNCTMDKSNSQLVVDCDLIFDTGVTCDRCLTEFERNYSEHFKNVYFITSDIENMSSDEPGIYYMSPNEDKIDLLKDVTDIINISAPLKVICSDECKGICPSCGQNLNESECKCEISIENPIWEPLKKLKENLNK